jgi:uncharacterized membrane protein
VSSRRGYLDWLRGVAVLIMIGAHTLDAWTRLDDRGTAAYGWAMIIAGFGAPIFLFLAGVALPLAAGSRQRKGSTAAEAAAVARRRGWQIFGLAFLFRLQSWAISGGSWQSILKVDILNVMGLGMLAAALLWGAGRDARGRAVLLAAGATAVAMLSPIIRSTDVLTPLADPIEWYFRPAVGRATFTLFPWAAFLLAGAAIGLWVDAARTERQEQALNGALAVAGPVIALAGYGASFLPSIYAESSFWTTSPTFFFLRLGILMSAIPVAFLWTRLMPMHFLQEFGRASLFVYWIHVEMVYGVLSTPIRRTMSFPSALLAFAVFSAFLYVLVRLKNHVTTNRLDQSTLSPSRVGG